jgi:predicted DCC family thiol-disulfide oxidoreductase YuxK
MESKVANVEADHGSSPIDSVILIEDGKAYTHSTAALRIATHLSGLWSWLYIFVVVPAPIRDFFTDCLRNIDIDSLGERTSACFLRRT